MQDADQIGESFNNYANEYGGQGQQVDTYDGH